MRNTRDRKALYGAWAISSIALCCLLAVGCNKTDETTSTPPAGGAGGGPGGGGMQGPGGGMRGPGGGAPIAADASGADIVKASCNCHNGGRAPALASFSSRSESDLTSVIHDGKGKMPAFGSKLSDEQIKKVVTYLKGLKS